MDGGQGEKKKRIFREWQLIFLEKHILFLTVFVEKLMEFAA